MIYKVEAEGDVLYIEAESQADAEQQFRQKIGEVPANMLKWSTVAELPEDEELL